MNLESRLRRLYMLWGQGVPEELRFDPPPGWQWSDAGVLVRSPAPYYHTTPAEPGVLTPRRNLETLPQRQLSLGWYVQEVVGIGLVNQRFTNPCNEIALDPNRAAAAEAARRQPDADTRTGIIRRALDTEQGRAQLAAAMTAPLRTRLNYMVGRRAFAVQPLPPVAEQSVSRLVNATGLPRGVIQERLNTRGNYTPRSPVVDAALSETIGFDDPTVEGVEF